jgi:signal transduction histidine kinase
VPLPIEVSRLRLQLRAALDEARSSRARLAQSVAAERRRLERDLHDGAQQQIISAGMQVRAVQASLDPGVPAHAALDGVVESLELIVDELRTLAHGVRPRRLDDGLPAALRTLTSDLGAAVDLRAEDVDVSDVVATTLYFVVAECLVNALKHSQAGRLQVWLGNQADRVVAEIVDDGVGGAADGFGLSSIRDRVSAVGGELFIDSPAGGGTRVRVEI